MYVCVWLEELDKNPLVNWRDLKEALSHWNMWNITPAESRDLTAFVECWLVPMHTSITWRCVFGDKDVIRAWLRSFRMVTRWEDSDSTPPSRTEKMNALMVWIILIIICFPKKWIFGVYSIFGGIFTLAALSLDKPMRPWAHKANKICGVCLPLRARLQSLRLPLHLYLHPDFVLYSTTSENLNCTLQTPKSL